MSKTSMGEFVGKYEGWIRTLLIVGAICVTQFLNSKYLQIDTYKADQANAAIAAAKTAEESSKWREEITKSLQELKDMANRQEASFNMLRDQVVAQHQKQLDDHEQRMREQEKVTASIRPKK